MLMARNPPGSQSHEASSLDQPPGTVAAAVPGINKILFVGLYYDYGDPSRGLSYEYYNLYLTLTQLAPEVQLFDFHAVTQRSGKPAMQRELVQLVRETKPDIAIFPLFKDDDFDPAVMDELRQHTTTVCYFFDDMWRRKFADHWAPHFDCFTTSSSGMLRRYRERGLGNAIYSPFGYNHFLYRRLDVPKRYDVTFIGGFHPYRKWLLDRLRGAGINVAVWGAHWPAGRLSQEDMIRVLNESRISLNITDSKQWDFRYLVTSRSYFAWRDLVVSKKTREQLKARHFEICGCGTFQLTYYVEDLEHCFDIGRELMVYMDVADLIEKTRYFLKHEDEREAIAAAGYQRAVAEHTLARRLTDVLEYAAAIRRRKAATAI